ncbi:MAG: hypothetical protein J6Y95_05800, partial [Lachnospiraceae bacterium]|nr:hypothetical protein [Lachnospiraceae bacterium]
MIGCPKCGNKLVFDVDSQKMKCKYCESYFLISQASAWSKNAEEQSAADGEGLEITTFTCSQCGAEISADSDEAVTWCSFCGSPATLTSRLTRIRKPDVVVPFRMSHAACVDQYKKEARKQIYAPRDLIRRGDAEGFRGIYMPYWTYDIARKGPFSFQGETVEHYDSEHDVKTTYHIHGHLESCYNGLSHDASQTFDDYVSERIAPFNFTAQKPFDICYLNGFYANAADQDEHVYRSRIIKEEMEMVYSDANAKYVQFGLKEDSVINNLGVKGYGAGHDGWQEPFHSSAEPQETTVENYQEVLQTKRFNMKSKLAMFPVWFMSYRWGDRVSYATMNGDTGKMYAEFPASPRRFLAFSALSAIPLFFLIYMLYTLTPAYVLFIALAAAFGASEMFRKEVIEIFNKQYHIVQSEITRKKPSKFLFFLKICLIGLLMLMPSIQLWWE